MHCALDYTAINNQKINDSGYTTECFILGEFYAALECLDNLLNMQDHFDSISRQTKHTKY